MDAVHFPGNNRPETRNFRGDPAFFLHAWEQHFLFALAPDLGLIPGYFEERFSLPLFFPENKPSFLDEYAAQFEEKALPGGLRRRLIADYLREGCAFVPPKDFSGLQSLTAARCGEQWSEEKKEAFFLSYAEALLSLVSTCETLCHWGVAREVCRQELLPLCLEASALGYSSVGPVLFFAFFKLSRLCLALDEPEEARNWSEALGHIRLEGPSSTGTLPLCLKQELSGCLCFHAGDLDGARSKWEELLSLCSSGAPGSLSPAHPCFRLGVLALSGGDTDRALALFEQGFGALAANGTPAAGDGSYEFLRLRALLHTGNGFALLCQDRDSQADRQFRTAYGLQKELFQRSKTPALSRDAVFPCAGLGILCRGQGEFAEAGRWYKTAWSAIHSLRCETFSSFDSELLAACSALVGSLPNENRRYLRYSLSLIQQLRRDFPENRRFLAHRDAVESLLKECGG